MKKTLAIAAQSGSSGSTKHLPSTASASTITTSAAATGNAVAAAISAAQWNDYWNSKGLHVTTPIAWWTCAKAEDGSKHLLDCDSN